MSETEHRLVLSMHHIIGDRGSLQVLEHQVVTHYTQLLDGQTSEEPLPIQYPDFAHWEANRTIAADHYAYWRTRLAGELPLVALPYDHQRPPAPSFRGATLRTQLPLQTSDQLRSIARTQQTTLNTVVLALYNAFLFRYTGQQDILIGSPVSTRDQSALQDLVGFFNETVVLRQQVAPEASFADLVAAVQPTLEDALKYKDVPFDWLVNELQPERRGGMSPLFQTMYVYNAAAPQRALPEGLRLEGTNIELPTAKFDLTLFATELGHNHPLELSLEYATDLFDPRTIEAMLQNIAALATGLAADPNTKIGYAPLLPATTQRVLLEDWNGSFLSSLRETASPTLLPQLVVENTQKFDNKIAVTDGATSLTWAELYANAANLAFELKRNGITPGAAVGLYCGRSPDLLVGIVGIHLAGGAYVPLDPEYPRERIDYIVGDCGASIIVHEASLTPPLPDGTAAIAIPQNCGAAPPGQFFPPNETQPAYLIYTSGSTGQPKGIVISHGNLARSTAARFQYYDQQPGVFLLLSSFAFDSSVAGIFWTLASGGTLVLSARRAEQDPAALGQLIHREKVTHTLLLPSLYQLLLEFALTEDLTSLNTVMVAGEACPAALVNHHYAKLPNTRLVNEYGPTEGTVWSTAHRIVPQDGRGNVPIGQPIPGMGHYVLDARLQPVPIG
ncbi:MAG: AMP-binding protein, partial [Bacteroidota bacterium]